VSHALAGYVRASTVDNGFGGVRALGCALSFNSSGNVNLQYWNGGVPQVAVGGAVNKGLAANRWYWARIRGNAAGDWSWKVWAGSFDSEPGSYDVAGANDTTGT